MRKKSTTIFFSIVLLALPAVVLAAPVNPNIWFKTLTNNLMSKVVWPLFIGLVVIMCVWAGVLFLTAKGDTVKLKSAQSMVIWIVVGVTVGLLSYSLIDFIRGLIPV